jgi:hypothetical protein
VLVIAPQREPSASHPTKVPVIVSATCMVQDARVSPIVPFPVGVLVLKPLCTARLFLHLPLQDAPWWDPHLGSFLHQGGSQPLLPLGVTPLPSRKSWTSPYTTATDPSEFDDFDMSRTGREAAREIRNVCRVTLPAVGNEGSRTVRLEGWFGSRSADPRDGHVTEIGRAGNGCGSATGRPDCNSVGQVMATVRPVGC